MNPSEIPEAFDQLKNDIPEEANRVVQWFEDNYVHGRVRRTLRNGNIIRDAPMFPPLFWSVVDNIEYTFPRTINSVEAWHRRWEVLAGRDHVGIFKIIKDIQKEQNKVQLEIEMVLRGTPRPSQRQRDRDRETRIQTILNDRSNRSIMDFLRGIAYNISF